MALKPALKKRIALANKFIKFAQQHDIFGLETATSSMDGVYRYPHLITVSPKGRSVRVRYEDAYAWPRRTKYSESFNTNDPDAMRELRHEITTYVINPIKRGAKQEGIPLPSHLR